ncbi:MAG: V-type ATP synthase subunit I [Kiritimatiellia bacterium]
MKKLTLLCVAHDRAATLEALRGLGVLHVTPVVSPASTGLEDAREKAAGLQRLLEAVPATPALPPTGRDLATVIADVSDLLDQRKEWQERLEFLKAELDRIALFGAFEPAAVRALARNGVVLKLYRASAKSVLPLPAGVAAQQMGVRKSDAFWALFAREPFEWAGAEELKLPEGAPDQLQYEAERLDVGLAGIAEELKRTAGDRALLEQAAAAAAADVRFQEVRAGMGTTEKIAYVQGFAPVDAVAPAREAAARHGWGLVVEDPGPQDDVPVKLKPPRWATPIKAVFQGIDILPAYHEADVSVVFMLFFSLFFAMIIGDAGYGAIFVGLTLWARKKLPKDAFRLLLVTSAATIVWGLVTGTVFGISPDILARAGFDQIQIPFLTDPARAAQNVMGLCFLIGAVQITVGHVWNVVELLQAKKLKALEQFGWVLTTWFMFFLADSMVLNGNMTSYLHLTEAQDALLWKGLGIAMAAGTALILLFMMPPKEIKDGWFNLALLPLNLVGNFTDVVSYVRLYAVGTAGFAVANAFNTMIFPGGDVSLVGLLVGAVFAFLAHTLNILLCVMGVLVHGIRLNTLEFSNHKGITWSGSAYRPFAKTGAAA